MDYYIYLDDIREDPTWFHQNCDLNHWNPILVRNFEQAVRVLNEVRGNVIIIDLDHDLGFDHDLTEDKTGYDVCKYIVEERIPLYGFHIHSMNPVGAQNMRQLLTHYGYREV